MITIFFGGKLGIFLGGGGSSTSNTLVYNNNIREGPAERLVS